VERQKQAVEAICRDQEGGTLAVEHTLVQPFVGEKDDNQRFQSAFVPLEQDASLRMPGFVILLTLPVGAIPKVRWEAVGSALKDWLRRERDGFAEGSSRHSISGLSFPLTVSVDKMVSRCYADGRVLVGRSDMPENFRDVIKKALDTKLPKLAATTSDERILLLEMDNVPRNPIEVTDAIDSLQREFPDLAKIEEVWCALTNGWETEGSVFFTRAWPRSAVEWPSFTVSAPFVTNQP
jgi:hypothetical protein